MSTAVLSIVTSINSFNPHNIFMASILLSSPFIDIWDFLLAQTVKNLPATQETWVQSLGWEDPLEKGMATHFSIVAWRIPWTKEPGGL